MSPEGAASQMLERRQERRVTVRLPMHVRGTDREGKRFEEITHSENICRSGAAFCTWQELSLGDNVEIHIPVHRQGSEAETDFATRGRVVHIAPGKGTRECIVGIQFIGPRFHRLFQSENTN